MGVIKSGASGWRRVIAEDFTFTGVRAAGGILVTASHNPPGYNGVKFSDAGGGPGLPAVTKQVETRANSTLADTQAPAALGTSLREAEASRLIERIDPRESYLDRLRSLVDLGTLRGAGLRVVDPLFGSGRGYLDWML